VPVYWPGGVRRLGDVSLVCRACTERGKAGVDIALGRCGSMGEGDRECVARRKPETLSTDATLAGGPARSSGEALVIGVEQRGRLI
jgi:hypothetical protein